MSADELNQEIARALDEALEQARRKLASEPLPGAIFGASELALQAVAAAATRLATRHPEPLSGQYQSWYLAGRMASAVERLLVVLHHQTRRARGGHAGDIARLAASHGELLRRTVNALMEETETDRLRRKNEGSS